MTRRWRKVFEGTIRKPADFDQAYEIICDPVRLEEYVRRAEANKNKLAKAGPFQIRLK